METTKIAMIFFFTFCNFKAFSVYSSITSINDKNLFLLLAKFQTSFGGSFVFGIRSELLFNIPYS